MEKDCRCVLQITFCPDPQELIGGSQFPEMPCSIIIEKLVNMQARIAGNLDSSIQGLDPVEREISNFGRIVCDLTEKQMVQLE